jgi:aspartyl/asparaginyl beta-hydroxylase (cupin superfamily)
VAQSGFDALRDGRYADALAQFEQLAAAGVADGSVFFAMAIAHQRSGDTSGALAAVERALTLSPAGLQRVQLLILKGDVLAAQGEARDASACYLAAIRAVPDGAAVPPEIAAELNRAQRECDQYAGGVERKIRSQLEKRVPDLAAAPRVAEAIDILFGKKKPYTQQPRYFFFPGLAPVTFFDPADFPWIPALESQTELITQELQAVLRDRNAFHPYVEGDPKRPSSTLNDQNGMLNNSDWSAFYLWKNGALVEENASRCPQTVAALSKVPLASIPGRSPSVLFSLLKPGAHIPAHNGLINTRLIVHLPLIIPGNCHFRVGNDTRAWQKGKVWLFDDTIEHEAWNNSALTRVILLFEIDRPDISARELEAVREVFAAIDANSGRAPEWEI